MSRAARANHKCPIIMEFENGSLQEFVRCGPGATSHYINQDETAIINRVWEFLGQEPNNSVYLAPIDWDITR